MLFLWDDMKSYYGNQGLDGPTFIAYLDAYRAIITGQAFSKA